MSDFEDDPFHQALLAPGVTKDVRSSDHAYYDVRYLVKHVGLNRHARRAKAAEARKKKTA